MIRGEVQNVEFRRGNGWLDVRNSEDKGLDLGRGSGMAVRIEFGT